MRRRAFLELVGGAVAGPALWPLAAHAQQRGKLARVGIIGNAPIWDVFRKGLRDLGYVEGQTVAYDYRGAEGKPERLAEAAAELARLPVNLFATYGTQATRAARQASETIPIVFIGVGDPVKAGLTASLARPGGNATGNTILSPDVAPKRLQLLREVLPSARSLVFLWNPDNASNEAILDQLKPAAPRAGFDLIPVPARNAADLDAARALVANMRPHAVMITNDPLHQLHITSIIEVLTRNGIPSLFQARENVVAGGFMSYGPSLPDLFHRGALYAHKILAGAKPADLPVEQASKFLLTINLRTAKALGLEVPESFLLRADEVIE